MLNISSDLRKYYVKSGMKYIFAFNIFIALISEIKKEKDANLA